jgi:hypothetical protein
LRVSRRQQPKAAYDQAVAGGRPESLTLSGIDPVAGMERLLEVVTAPTGEAVRILAGTMGTGSAWISRAETEEVIVFLEEWLAATAER